MTPRSLLRQLGTLFTVAAAALKKPLTSAESERETEHVGDGAKLRRCMELAMSAAEREWQRPVMEPPGEGWQEVDKYIRAGLEWKRKPYTENRSFAWCGAFAAWVFGAAGLGRGIRQKTMASTYRMWRDWRKTDRLVPKEDMRRGDIVVVTRGKKRWGDHITICAEPPRDAKTYRTIEGNARGLGPTGKRYEGVVKNRRRLEDVAFVYRLKAGDFGE